MSGLPLNAVVGNKYRVEKRVGAGGMGEVYRATNLQTRVPVAVKVLTNTGDSSAALARFRNEAVIQYNLHHPNVAELYEYFEFQGCPCIVMEFVEGRTLDEWIRDAGALPPAQALAILADICDAVSYMHSKGTIHRDIKSENIRINPQGQVKLLDFGISVSRNTPSFTKAGCSIGTPGKMAPEQHLGSRGDARSDVWSLGILLYEMVAGAAPFPNSDPTGVREDVMALRYFPVARRKPGVPKAIVKIISNCLRLKPEERYASSGVMLREVQQARRQLTGGGWQSKPWTNPAVVAGALALLVIGLLIYAFSSSTPGAVPPSSAPGKSPVAALPSTPSTPVSGAPTPTRPKPSAPEPLPPSAIPAPRAASSAPSPTPPSPDYSSAEQKTVRVATYDGPAEVTTKEGQVLGSTPFSLTGPFGKNYELWLRREGYQPHRIEVQINNKGEYTFGLERLESRSDSGKKD